MVEWHVLGFLTVLLLGGSLFLRIVAKEARRREKHLLLRLENERKAEEEAALMAKNKNGNQGAEMSAEGEAVMAN